MDRERKANLPRAIELQGDVTVFVDGLELTYRVYQEQRPSLRQLVARGFRSREYRDIHAVRQLTFAAHAGEAIGVIGRNGSGKSTLLKAIAGLLPPTSGAVYTSSEPMLLGVGSVLNANLSGRRNILLGGLALGLSKRDIESRFGEIVDFAGLADFIDLPLKAYSTGMAARLHFAIASAVEPEILLIDEALAVGDEDFQRRSRQRLDELRERAGTVFLVSHSMSAITEMCTRAVWLDQGWVIEEGDPQDVVDAYRSWVADEPKRRARRLEQASGSDRSS